ncbi:hypothetical protein DRH27_04605 [Candidatus Falkowbacteria bacterium]|nr:MAG: hypothetical protein DRH27_04605 [Candidatus Falkowbacteria bacterium]
MNSANKILKCNYMNLSDKFGKKIINKIVKEKIRPKSKWQFLLRDWVVWGAGILSLVIGSLSFAVILYLYKFNDWNLYLQITDSFAEFILLTLPYFWLLFVVIFIFILYYNIKHTKKGYRYPLPVVLAASVLLSIMLGSLFFKVGLGQAIDDVLGQKAPLYTQLFNRQLSYWSEPQKGRLSGIVISIITDTEFLLLDLEKNEWKIVNTSERRLLTDLIQIKRPIRLIGEIISEDIFEVERIMPVGPGREFFMRGGHMRMPSLKDIERMNNNTMDMEELKERIKEFSQRQKMIPEMIKNNPELNKQIKPLELESEIIGEMFGK